MIITDKFVFVHVPKTAGTFVRNAITRLYDGHVIRGRLSEAEQLAPSTGGKFCFESQVKHISRRRIPEFFNHLPIVGSFRNPFERYVSQFLFGTWQALPEQFPGLENCSGYPNVTFSDYVLTANEKHWHISKDLIPLGKKLGWQTLGFLQAFGRHESLIDLLDFDFITVDKLNECISPITILQTNSINQDLFDALIKVGYPADEVRFILDLSRVVPDKLDTVTTNTHDHFRTTRSNNMRSPEVANKKNGLSRITPTALIDWRTFYDENLRDYVIRRERLLVDLYPKMKF
ncbi:MAG: hypothetical protein DHS20C01_12200 [marine bacterium B5-7]|nr:MAG: hypothetical protein DHS20C01_12200 [marine bacterium B5-7]